MKFISEDIIDAQYVRIANLEDRAVIFEKQSELQPAITAYLASESFAILTNYEKDYVTFLTATLWECVYAEYPEQKQIDPKKIEEAEDRNWELYADSKGKTFRDKLTVFFENTNQEDLLAFFEDAVMESGDDEADDEVTPEGRAFIFIVLKTILDSLEGVLKD